jgi:hypothetical protein
MRSKGVPITHDDEEQYYTNEQKEKFNKKITKKTRNQNINKQNTKHAKH